MSVISLDGMLHEEEAIPILLSLSFGRLELKQYRGVQNQRRLTTNGTHELLNGIALGYGPTNRTGAKLFMHELRLNYIVRPYAVEFAPCVFRLVVYYQRIAAEPPAPGNFLFPNGTGFLNQVNIGNLEIIYDNMIPLGGNVLVETPPDSEPLSFGSMVSPCVHTGMLNIPVWRETTGGSAEVGLTAGLLWLFYQTDRGPVDSDPDTPFGYELTSAISLTFTDR